MSCASKFFTSVGVVLIAVATAVALGPGVSFAQGMAGPAPVPDYATGGSFSQTYGSQTGGSYTGATAPGSSGDISVPMTGGGQITVPEPNAEPSGAASSSRGGVWSLERTNPDSLGGVPQTGP